MGFQVKPFQFGSSQMLFRGNAGSTSDLLARADLLELLDRDVYDELEKRSDTTDEDVVVLVNRYLRQALSSGVTETDNIALTHE